MIIPLSLLLSLSFISFSLSGLLSFPFAAKQLLPDNRKQLPKVLEFSSRRQRLSLLITFQEILEIILIS